MNLRHINSKSHRNYDLQPQFLVPPNHLTKIYVVCQFSWAWSLSPFLSFGAVSPAFRLKFNVSSEWRTLSLCHYLLGHVCFLHSTYHVIILCSVQESFPHHASFVHLLSNSRPPNKIHGMSKWIYHLHVWPVSTLSPQARKLVPEPCDSNYMWKVKLRTSKNNTILEIKFCFDFSLASEN